MADDHTNPRGRRWGAYQLCDPVACRTELIDLYVGASAGGRRAAGEIPGCCERSHRCPRSA
jgi:hypothetical protein